MSKLPAKQRGISLISLMIALLIGTFLLAGLFDIWFQTRQTFSAQAQLAQLQDNQRMALTIMANTVQSAGYYPIYRNYPPYTPPPTPYSIDGSFPVIGDYLVEGQSIFGTVTGTAGGDTLEVRFVADGANTLDCLGQPDPVGALVVNTYSVSSANNLQCTVSVTPTGGVAVVTGPLTVVAGVTNLAVTYNVTTPGTPPTYQYMNATGVTAVASNAGWTSVQSANITLTFSNPLSGQPGQAATMTPISRIVAVTVPNPNS